MKYTYWVAVERDITERKQVEETPRANEERFQRATRAGRSAIWKWDVAVDVKWWSERLREIFGYTWDATTNLQDPIRRENVHAEDLASLFLRFGMFIFIQNWVMEPRSSFISPDRKVKRNIKLCPR